MKSYKRTKPHRFYKSPSPLEIRRTFKELKYKGEIDLPLVRDLANACSHEMYGKGAFESLEDLSLRIKESSFETFAEYLEVKKYHETAQSFIKNVNYSLYSGNTPLEKAAAIMAAMNKEESGESGKGDEEGEPTDTKETENGEEGENEKSTEKKRKIFSEGEEQMLRELRKQEQELADFLEADTSLSKYETNPHNKTPEVAMSELTRKQKDYLEILSKLREGKQLDVKGTPAVEQVTLMNDFEQVSKIISPVEMLMPTFDYRFATQQLIVKRQEQGRKQTLFYIIDDSGSMSSQEKVAWVKALTINRLEAVYDGKAELMIGWFITDLDYTNIQYIRNKTEAKRFYDRKFYGRFNGGNTNVEQAVKTAIDVMQKMAQVTKPEIVVINDGEDLVNNFKPSVKVHGFILGRDNQTMQKMCAVSGGTYTRYL